jgi:hypothetical protein
VITEAIKKYYSKDAPLPPSFPPPYDPYADEPWQPHRETDTEFFKAVKEKTNTIQGIGNLQQRGAPRFYVSTRAPGLGQAEQNPIRFYAISDPNQDAAQQTLRGMGQDLDPTPTIVSAPPFLQGFEEDATPTIPNFRSVRAPEVKQTEGPKVRKILKPLAPPPTIEALFPAPDDLLADLQKAERVDEVLDLVFGYISYSYPRQLFLLNKPGLLQGFRGFALPCEAGELKVPLNSPSLFTSVLLSQYPYVGAITLTRATRGLLRSLGYPCYAVLLPIQVGSRTIGVFLGDQGEPMRNADTHTFIQLRQLTTEVSQAFIRILKKKRSEVVDKQITLSEEEPSGKLS